MSALYILPCGKKKIWDKQPDLGKQSAGEAYIGTFHKLCRNYTDVFSGRVLILSAKYGLVDLDDKIDGPYDVRFPNNLISFPNDKNIITFKELNTQIEQKQLHLYSEWVSLGGKKFIPILDHLAPKHVRINAPLVSYKGLGYMQQALKQAIDNGTELRRNFIERE